MMSEMHGKRHVHLIRNEKDPAHYQHFRKYYKIARAMRFRNKTDR